MKSSISISSCSTYYLPEVKETRNRDRFIKVAEHAGEFTPDKPEVRDFINFLKEHHTVLDPTMSVFEALFCGDPTAITPGLEAIVPRFPPQVRRAMRSKKRVRSSTGQTGGVSRSVPGDVALTQGNSRRGCNDYSRDRCVVWIQPPS